MFIARRPQPEREHTFGLGRHHPSNSSLCHAAGELDYRPSGVTQMNQLQARERMKFALIAAILAGLVTAASAEAKVTDPRKCATVTPGGPSKHSYWCAKYAAADTVRTVMARKQGVARWYPAVYCDQGSSLLRWSCVTFLGGDHWKVAVTWKATRTGWHRYASVTKTL